MRRVVLLGSLMFMACAGTPEPQANRPAPQTPEAKTAYPEPRPDGRLPNTASPTGYTIAFDVDPAKEQFSANETIGVTIPAATSYIVLHAHNLSVSRATVTSAGKTQDAKPTMRKAAGAQDPEELVLEVDHVLAAGPASIALTWTGPFDQELSGLYHVQKDNRWYAYTQFESTDARRAYPSFDEPGFKVPFEISIKAPAGMVAVSNSNEASRDGNVFKFNKTPNLPTYLLAFAVGDFDIKEANRNRAPKIRIVAPKGETANGFADSALESTSALTDILGDYFGIPYPFEKLDIVAVPEFAAGAMENPGLITYRSELLLLDPKHGSQRSLRAQAEVGAHELAHQWFGDLVTAAWWNDIWLNEGMATWMESKAVDKYKPDWHVLDDAAASSLGVMDTDGLSSARAVRQPVKTTSEIEEAFDGITYQKGGAVLATIEKWVGPDAFQKGIRAYLTENAGKSVTTDKLFSALDKASGKNVSKMAFGYVDRPGVPLVDITRTCEAGGRWSVELTQEQWKPLGSKAKDQGVANWTVPVCMRAAGEKADVCAELNEGAPSAASGKGCPAWIHPNSANSYYRFDASEKEILALTNAKTQLDAPARLAVLSNAYASARAGKLSMASLLKILPAFDDDQNRQVTGLVGSILHDLRWYFFDETSTPGFQKYAAARFAKKRTLPAKPTADDLFVHRTALWVLVELGNDDAATKEVNDITTKWLADSTSVDHDIAQQAAPLASHKAGMARLNELRAVIKNPKSGEDRVTALRALMGFDDAKVHIAALDLLLTDEIKFNDARTVLWQGFERPATRNLTEKWSREHWDAMRKRLQGNLGHALLTGAVLGCSTKEVEEKRQWYGTHAADMPGAARPLAEMYEENEICAAIRTTAKVSFEKALRGGK